jgi:hypothetical protein
MFVGEPMALAADATLDLGQVVMPVGGTAVVTIEGGRAGAWFQCVGADDRPRTDWLEKDGTLVSPLLVPGQHRLLVSGKTVAAQAIAFVVRAGEVTRVAVKLGTGTRQRIEIAPPVLDPLPGVVALVVHRGGELLRTTGIALRAGEASVDETCLAPGDYTVTIADGERRLARATFTVGATEAPPLRLERAPDRVAEEVVHDRDAEHEAPDAEQLAADGQHDQHQHRVHVHVVPVDLRVEHVGLERVDRRRSGRSRAASSHAAGLQRQQADRRRADERADDRDEAAEEHDRRQHQDVGRPIIQMPIAVRIVLTMAISSCASSARPSTRPKPAMLSATSS